jgi:hypothetical protein
VAQEWVPGLAWRICIRFHEPPIPQRMKISIAVFRPLK